MTRYSSDDDAREHLVQSVHDALAAHDPDPARLAAIRAHLASAPVRGGTTLRDRPHRSPWWIAGAVAAAAAAVILMVVLPAVDRQTTVSAAEILGRSRAALSSPATGIEVLTYDLSVDGVLADLVPSEQTGQFTVEETIDHDRPGRYRLLKLAPGGDIVGGIADDPVRGARVRYLRAHGRGYLLRFADANVAAFSLPAVKRMALQAFITLMQAGDDQAVRETTCDGEACYEVIVPQAADAAGGIVSLSHARALITAADARIVELSATGRIAERPFGIEFVLKNRVVRAATAADQSAFDITPRPGDIVLQGNASSNPMWDVIERTLAAIPQQPSR